MSNFEKAHTKAEDLARAAVQAIFVDFEAQKAAQLLAADYIQHNPGVPTGAAPILGFIPALKESGIKVTTHRVIAENDIVVFHSTYENAQLFGAPTLVAFDVFRVEGDKVVEHWDNLSPLAAPNPSGRSQTDGPTARAQGVDVASNKALVKSFIETVLMRGDVSSVASFISPASYAQHNSAIADGLVGLGAALAEMAKHGITMEYHKLHRVVGEGDFVFTMSEGKFAGEPTAFYDLFRVENGLIVEHWDIIAGIPSEMAHANGKF